MQNNMMIRAMDKERTVRVMLARTTDLVEEARVRQNTTPTATSALGRVLTATVMMGLELKGQESITLRVKGDGPLGTILAVGESDGTVRGYIANPDVDMPEKAPGKLDVGNAVGTEGFIEVVRDMGLRSPFTGSAPLVSGEIAEDLAHYFMVSEQIPSLVSLGVLIERDHTVGAAGGLFVQAMPQAENDMLEKLELNITRLGPVSNLIKIHDDMESILDEIFLGLGSYDIIDNRNVTFACRCSREKIVSIISALEEDDIQKALEDQGCLEAVCNFCNEVYRFSPNEVKLIRGTETK
ncbi:MAG: Hsp33 family molecular chaperone HslO [Ignavibacteriales bacterium]